MDWHVSMYSGSFGLVTNTAIAAANDDIIQIDQGSNFIMTDPYNLLLSAPMGTTLTRARFQSPSLIRFGSNHLYIHDRNATPGDLPQPTDYRDRPFELPVDEPIQLQVTTDAAGPARVEIPLVFAAPTWDKTIPYGEGQLISRATVTPTAGAAGLWGPLANLTFEQTLMVGTYAVIGAEAVAASGVAFRLFFPDSQLTYGKILRPGWLCRTAIGNRPTGMFDGQMGEWGRFYTFSPPTIQFFGAVAATPFDVWLHLIRLGTSKSLLRR